LLTGDDLTSWNVQSARYFPGERTMATLGSAPLGLAISREQCAPERGDWADQAASRGWEIRLGHGPIGDGLLALGALEAFREITERQECEYFGPRPDVFGIFDNIRTSLKKSGSPHIIRSLAGTNSRLKYFANPDSSRLRLAERGHGLALFADLPIRFYLEIEEWSGQRLAAERDVLPHVSTSSRRRNDLLVVVGATSNPDKKALLARHVKALVSEFGETFEIVVLLGGSQSEAPFVQSRKVRVLAGEPINRCTDLFGSATAVVGSDTGLTHLAAITSDSRGSRTPTLGLHSRHSFLKWSTGSPLHGAIATPFAQMMAAADACPVRDRIDDRLWGDSSSMESISNEILVRSVRSLLEEAASCA